jgi:hypothetical protein
MSDMISRSGDHAEDLFRKLTGAEISKGSALGDAVLEGHYVEVKKIGIRGKDGKSTTTINQVRAVKYLPLVIWSELNNEWFVLPPNAVVALAAQRSRGQHTEVPFESMTLSFRHLIGHEVEASELRQATLEAIAEGERHPELREEMDWVRRAAKALAVESVERIQRLLDASS